MDVPASAKPFLDEIDRDLKENKSFINEKGRIAIMTSMRMLFSDETVFSNISKVYIGSFVSNIDKNLDIMLSKNLKKFALTSASKNLLLSIIDGKLIAFLTRGLGGQESQKWYDRVGRPAQTPVVR